MAVELLDLKGFKVDFENQPKHFDHIKLLTVQSPIGEHLTFNLSEIEDLHQLEKMLYTMLKQVHQYSELETFEDVEAFYNATSEKMELPKKVSPESIAKALDIPIPDTTVLQSEIETALKRKNLSREDLMAMHRIATSTKRYPNGIVQP